MTPGADHSLSIDTVGCRSKLGDQSPLKLSIPFLNASKRSSPDYSWIPATSHVHDVASGREENSNTRRGCSRKSRNNSVWSIPPFIRRASSRSSLCCRQFENEPLCLCANPPSLRPL